MDEITGHCRIDSSNISEQRYFSEFNCKSRGFNHFIFEDFGALGGIIEGVDVEITEINDRTVGSLVVDKSPSSVRKDIIEKIILDIFSPKRFCVDPFDRLRLPGDVLGCTTKKRQDEKERDVERKTRITRDAGLVARLRRTTVDLESERRMKP
jgi:hypothetical protein